MTSGVAHDGLVNRKPDQSRGRRVPKSKAKRHNIREDHQDSTRHSQSKLKLKGQKERKDVGLFSNGSHQNHRCRKEEKSDRTRRVRTKLL